MKDELKTKLVEILASIQGAASKASDFALEQLPDIAQSYVAYGRAWSVVSLVGLSIAFTAAALALRWGLPRARYDFASFAASSGGVMVMAVSAFAFMAQAKVATLVWFAPKVWLLKEIASLIK